ncbi:MAG TPA: hypothetical protein VES73_08670, partial [Lamprocystis sp. (in: g-proteobacteria)]|nr:hypothetical protein [Lamprocystis sp. (in: g-proteobacteria)]
GFVQDAPMILVGSPEHPGLPGLGLSSMRERAELSGGVFRLLTHPGSGTTIEVRWRLTNQRVG